MADIARRYFDQLQAANKRIFDLERTLETKQQQEQAGADTKFGHVDTKTINELERQAAKLNYQNQELVKKIGTLETEIKASDSMLKDAERELQVQNSQAQAKEKKMAGSIASLMEQLEGKRVDGTQGAITAIQNFQSTPAQQLRSGLVDCTMTDCVQHSPSAADNHAGDTVTVNSTAFRTSRASAQRARERATWRGYESDDSEDLPPFKKEPLDTSGSKTTAAVGQKRKVPDHATAYSTSLNKMQKMSLTTGVKKPTKQTKISMPAAKKGGRPLGSSNKKEAIRVSVPKSKSAKRSTAKPAARGKPGRLPAPGSLTSSPSRGRKSLAEISEFKFKMITTYNDKAQTDFGGYKFEDLTNEMSDFWDLLQRRKDNWEDCAGAYWSFDIERTTRSKKRRVCVDSTLQKRGTVWREGDEGFFACKDCVGAGRPCFTWAGEEEGFHCLPVHDEDRRRAVIEGKEIWYWVNEQDESKGMSEGESESGNW